MEYIPNDLIKSVDKALDGIRYERPHYFNEDNVIAQQVRYKSAIDPITNHNWILFDTFKYRENSVSKNNVDAERNIILYRGEGSKQIALDLDVSELTVSLRGIGMRHFTGNPYEEFRIGIMIMNKYSD